MTNGFLYSKLQPVQTPNPALSILEETRKSGLQALADAQKRRDKAYENLFSNMADLDVQGAFLADAVNTMESVKAYKVNLFREWSSGRINEADYRLKQEILDQTPLKFNAIYQAVDSKLKDLANGDQDMNADGIKDLTLLSSTAETFFNPKSMRIDVKYKKVDDNGKEVEVTDTLDNLAKKVEGISPIGKIEDPTTLIGNLFNGFNADIEKKPTSALETTLQQGYTVGTTEERFNNLFLPNFGNRDDLDNPYVMKQMVKDYGSMRTLDMMDEDMFKNAYHSAYEGLKNSALAKIQNRNEVTRKNPPSSGGKADKNYLDKSNTTILTATGKGGAPKTSVQAINVVNGQVDNVPGLGATYKLPDSQASLDLTYGELAGGEKITDSSDMSIKDATKVKVRSYFIDENNGDIYVQGVQDPEIFMRAVMGGGNVEQAMKNVKTITPYFKLNAEGADNFRAKVFGGMSSYEVLNYLKTKVGDQTLQDSGFSAEDFYNQYKNGNN